MPLEILNIADILVEDSKFSLKGYLFEAYTGPSCSITSFDTLGILFPVVVYQDSRKEYHLIDGKKRLQYAASMREKLIRSSVLPEKTPLTDIITLIFCNKRHDVQSSVINRVQFLSFAASLNVSESWILKSLCIPFNFKPHRSFLEECERIANLPEKIRLFCHEKRFSLKQLLNLTFYPVELLEKIIQWKSDLQLTASTLDEIASNLRDYLRREDMTVDQFINDPEVQEIFDSSLSPRDKTDRLRKIINMKKFPILYETNKKISETVNALKLPGEIKFNWDNTLEDKNIHLSIDINDPSKWEELLDRLKSPETAEAIDNILNRL